jgi:hypothetical protein
MNENVRQKIKRLEDELQSIMYCYASAKACQQDRLDERVGQIEDELKVLRAS